MSVRITMPRREISKCIWQKVELEMHLIGKEIWCATSKLSWYWKVSPTNQKYTSRYVMLCQNIKTLSQRFQKWLWANGCCIVKRIFNSWFFFCILFMKKTLRFIVPLYAREVHQENVKTQTWNGRMNTLNLSLELSLEISTKISKHQFLLRHRDGLNSASYQLFKGFQSFYDKPINHIKILKRRFIQ